MRELSQIDGELSQVRQALDRAGKLDAVLADLERQQLRLRQAAARAFGEWTRAEEKADFLASGREAEDVDGQLRRDRQAVLRAQARYEEAEWDLRDLEERLWDRKEERAGLREQESRYQALLREKEQYLCCTGSPQVPRLVEIARELGAVQRQLRELGEALEAGETAQAKLGEMALALEQAKTWGWDMPGGQANLARARGDAREVRNALSRLRGEVVSLSPREVPQADLEGFAAFLDWVQEGLFAGLFEEDGGERTRGEVQNARCEVDALVKGLREALEEQERRQAALNKEREARLAGTERRDG